MAIQVKKKCRREECEEPIFEAIFIYLGFWIINGCSQAAPLYGNSLKGERAHYLEVK
jgi:hypothetical protein